MGEWGSRRKLLSTAKARPKTSTKTTTITTRTSLKRRLALPPAVTIGWRAKFVFDEFITFDVQTRKLLQAIKQAASAKNLRDKRQGQAKPKPKEYPRPQTQTPNSRGRLNRVWNSKCY